MLRNLLALAALVTFSGPLGAQSPARGLRDQQIEDEIHARLTKSVIGKENFKVRVKEGVAFWEGSTSVAQRKGAATRMSKAAGAKSVVNNILVRPPVPKTLAPEKGAVKSPTRPSAETAPPPAPRRVKVQWGSRP